MFDIDINRTLCENGRMRRCRNPGSGRKRHQVRWTAPDTLSAEQPRLRRMLPAADAF